jgi:histidyl-tRNA synthetase
LVEQLGGKPTPAVGFAMGIERLVLLLEALNVVPDNMHVSSDVYIVAVGDVVPYALKTAEILRNELQDRVIVSHCGGGSFKNQMKKADKSGAAIALIIGEDEMASEQLTVKYLRDSKVQATVTITQCITMIKAS